MREEDFDIWLGLFRETAADLCEPEITSVFLERAERVAQSLKLAVFFRLPAAAAWLGMAVGMSFLATPVKFQASSLNLPVALEVGRVTFAAFSKVERCMSLLLVIATFIPRAPRAEVVFTTIAVLIVLVQALWLLPVLDAPVEAVNAGQPMPPFGHHLLYAGLEAAKAALAAVALVALFRLGWRDKPEAVAE